MDALEMECEVCGGSEFHKESGHFYCNECQTQSQKMQEHVFEREEVNIKSTRKIQEQKKDKSDELLTSWECYNYIIKGLTEELLSLGAKPELKTVVKLLWMKYLHKCEVFSVNSNCPPKLNVLGPRRDVDILWSIKKRTRKRIRLSSESSWTLKHERSMKRRALILSQYDSLSESQSITQESLANSTLTSLKSDRGVSSASSKNRNRITYNKYSSRELCNIMPKGHVVQHREDLERDLSCHKITARSFKSSFREGPANLTLFTIYVILYISLLISGDSIQLGDLLRFIREGHVSFACFRHFFPIEISEKSLILPQRHEKMFSHTRFRQGCASLIKFLGIASYITPPDLNALCTRYCLELNLPSSINQYAQRLISLTAPQMPIKEKAKVLPNYEGRAMSFIIFILKLLFAFDGRTEKKFSEYAQLLNDDKNPMFDVVKWLQFIEYRRVVLQKCHLPTALRYGREVDSDLFLSYLTNQKIQFKGSNRTIQNEVKDYLQVFEKLLEDGVEDASPIFEPSPTPFRHHTHILSEQCEELSANKEILLKSFEENSLEFLFNPAKYLNSLGCLHVKNGGANDDIITHEFLHLYKVGRGAYNVGKKVVPVKICSDSQGDKCVGEYLDSLNNPSLKTTNIKVLLENWKEVHTKAFKHNYEVLYGDQLKPLKKGPSYPQHYHPFERYWMNVALNPKTYYFSKRDMEVLNRSMPPYFRMVLAEASRVVEQEENFFYGEFLATEIFLTSFEGYNAGKVKGKSKGVIELRALLKIIRDQW
ncbi:TATA box-binding protein-associated factor RNA polymerase I subunit B [Euwallacea fornicatus]|uniref:TATA box-binding protein-associated factor RNA polymerase I subunit B n=1 Tax=Euwallacea fornicatus TaxID=995702 RepID=UPI0033905A4B